MAEEPNSPATQEETVTLITPLDKHKVVVKKNITGYDRRKIQAVYEQGVQIDTSDMDAVKDDPAKSLRIETGSLVGAAKDKQIELMVVSVDGKTEDLVNEVLKMKAADNEYVEESLEKITRGTFGKKAPDKKKSGESTKS